MCQYKFREDGSGTYTKPTSRSALQQVLQFQPKLKFKLTLSEMFYWDIITSVKLIFSPANIFSLAASMPTDRA